MHHLQVLGFRMSGIRYGDQVWDHQDLIGWSLFDAIWGHIYSSVSVVTKHCSIVSIVSIAHLLIRTLASYPYEPSMDIREDTWSPTGLVITAMGLCWDVSTVFEKCLAGVSEKIVNKLKKRDEVLIGMWSSLFVSMLQNSTRSHHHLRLLPAYLIHKISPIIHRMARQLIECLQRICWPSRLLNYQWKVLYQIGELFGSAAVISTNEVHTDQVLAACRKSLAICEVGVERLDVWVEIGDWVVCDETEDLHWAIVTRPQSPCVTTDWNGSDRRSNWIYISITTKPRPLAMFKKVYGTHHIMSS